MSIFFIQINEQYNEETSRIGKDILVKSNINRITQFAKKIDKDKLSEGLTGAYTTINNYNYNEEPTQLFNCHVNKFNSQIKPNIFYLF
jgi:hypothetical protein